MTEPWCPACHSGVKGCHHSTDCTAVTVRHQCDGEFNWCDDCERRERDRGHLADLARESQDWGVYDGQWVFQGEPKHGKEQAVKRTCLGCGKELPATGVPARMGVDFCSAACLELVRGPGVVDTEEAIRARLSSEPEPGACGDPECYVLHADPANPIHPPWYVDSRTT